MANKEFDAKGQPLPYLSAAIPHGLHPRFYNPACLCKVSTYLELCHAAGKKISLQALYERCQRGTIPNIRIDGTPYVILCAPVETLKQADPMSDPAVMTAIVSILSPYK